MGDFSFSFSENAGSDEARRIAEGLTAFNDSKVSPSGQKNFVISVKNVRGEIVGGIVAHTIRGWLYIHQLWVADSYRSTGLGSQLMIRAEAEAISRGCIGGYLNTYSFQALEFYKRHGFEIFGELEDFPAGHKNLFLKKRFPEQ